MLEPGAWPRPRLLRVAPAAPCRPTRPTPRYEPRRPGNTLLYRIVERHLDELCELAADRYAKPLPCYVVETFRAFLKCGRLDHGFLRCRCDDCGHELLVPFSCARRGICPSCATRRMSSSAAVLVDRVLPAVPIRQWVLSLPFELRLLAARRPDALAATGRIFVQELFRRLRRATQLDASYAGAVGFTHRAGGSLNLNPHHHVAALDGVFVSRGSTESTALDFVRAPAPCHDELQVVAERVRRRTVRWLRRRGYLEERSPAALADELDSQSAADGLARWAMSGSGYERLDVTGKPDPAPDLSLEPRLQGRGGANCDGFDVNASVWIAGDDDVARERLMRYGSRPAFASERLSELDDGRVAYRIRYARRGATHRVMTPVELLARLAALIPPPRHPLTRYYGVLSSHSKHRAQVVPRLPVPRTAPPVHASHPGPSATTPSRASGQPRTTPEPSPCRLGRPTDAAGSRTTLDVHREEVGSDHPVFVPKDGLSQTMASLGTSDCREATAVAGFNVISARQLDRLLGGELLATSARLDWAKLMRRTLALDPLSCPGCGGRLRVIAEITDRGVIERILDHLATRPTRAPPAAATPAPTLH
ncbi:MAG: transposase [Deltaproteobacteria bacterium]|jgi:hypothetical protein|nr:transposase [Deltaproteobacteria bacterium]MBW2534319.1 transposase [Deltaproteobacteria bacterium]